MNNFQRMMAEEERRTPPPPPRIKENIGSTIKLYRFVGQVVELYLPRVVDLVVLLSGSEKNDASAGKNPALRSDKAPKQAPEPKKR